jgi:hypothetical protein
VGAAIIGAFTTDAPGRRWYGGRIPSTNYVAYFVVN